MIFIHLEIIGEKKISIFKKNLQKFLQFDEATWQNHGF